MCQPKYFHTSNHQDGAEGPIAAGQNKRRLRAKPTEDCRNQSVFAVINELPNQSSGNLGKNVGQKEDRPEDIVARYLLGDNQCHCHGEGKLDQ
jgi:hypothetical protein